MDKSKLLRLGVLALSCGLLASCGLSNPTIFDRLGAYGSNNAGSAAGDKVSTVYPSRMASVSVPLGSWGGNQAVMPGTFYSYSDFTIQSTGSSSYGFYIGKGYGNLSFSCSAVVSSESKVTYSVSFSNLGVNLGFAFGISLSLPVSGGGAGQTVVSFPVATIPVLGSSSLVSYDGGSRGSLDTFPATFSLTSIGVVSAEEYADQGYSAGYSGGYSAGFSGGYSAGYSAGGSFGYSAGGSVGFVNGYNSGYTQGYTMAGGDKFDIWALMSACLTMPFTFFSQAFDVDIFSGTQYAFNVGTIVYSFFAIFLIFEVVKIIIGLVK